MSPRSSECVHTEELEAEIERIEMEKLDLESAKLEFKADKLQWQLTKGGGSSFPNCDCKKQQQLETERAKLEAERVQLENEKSQLRVAQIKLKAAQSHLKNVKFEYNAAMSDLETARGHLEAALAQTEINNIKLEAAKISLEAAKKRYDLATKQLNAAKSKLEDAKTQLDIAAGSAGGNYKCSGLEADNAELRSEIAKLRKTVTDLQNEKQRLENEVKESRAEVEKAKKENKKPDSIINNPVVINGKNPIVFFDLVVNNAPIGRIVMELYADTTARKAEIFRKLCTGEMGVTSTGRPIHYKGTLITYYRPGYYIAGGDIAINSRSEAESIYGGILPGEGLIRKHSGVGDVTMLPGTSANMGCSFMISTKVNSDLDGQCVLVGKVSLGMRLLGTIQKVAWKDPVSIVNCGQISP